MVRIAIDGPGGAGKSSVAKAVSRELGIIYVDTGALYRNIGLFMLDKGIDPKDAEKVVPALDELTIELKFEDGKQVILLNGVDRGDEIRSPEASMAASAVSAIPAVRDYLLTTQRNTAKKNSVVMDGRDIGTVILPNAEVKIFLTASPETRAYGSSGTPNYTGKCQSVFMDGHVAGYTPSDYLRMGNSTNDYKKVLKYGFDYYKVSGTIGTF